MDSQTKERPIIFSTPMVRALIEGRKSQTRRIVKPQPPQEFCGPHCAAITNGRLWAFSTGHKAHPPGQEPGIACPFGNVGDRLFVREATGHVFTTAEVIPGCPAGCRLVYRADEPDAPVRKWRPSIHMPRVCSRITLTITGVRVERLADISESDAKAEGMQYHNGGGVGVSGWRHDINHGYVYPTAKEAFGALWEIINGDGACKVNPWVWALTFTTEVRK